MIEYYLKTFQSSSFVLSLFVRHINFYIGAL
jgi:hypothetical protein